MPWQKITRHITDHRVEVESKSGNRYPVEIESDHLQKSLYEQLTNRAHDEKTYWAWVDFDGDSPTLEDYVRKGDDSGPPDNPPWDR